MKLAQNKVTLYDCILDKKRTIDVPDLSYDALDRYKIAYEKLLKSKPHAFHKKRVNFSTFVDVSRMERELSASKSPRKDDERELPKICSRNCLARHHSSTFARKNTEEMPLDPVYIEDVKRARIERNKFSSPMKKHQFKPVAKTENLFLRKRMRSMTQHKQHEGGSSARLLKFKSEGHQDSVKVGGFRASCQSRL